MGVTANPFPLKMVGFKLPVHGRFWVPGDTLAQSMRSTIRVQRFTTTRAASQPASTRWDSVRSTATTWPDVKPPSPTPTVTSVVGWKRSSKAKERANSSRCSGCWRTGRTSKTVQGARRRTILVSVLESLRLHVPRFTLAGVLAEIAEWAVNGISRFGRMINASGLAPPDSTTLATLIN